MSLILGICASGHDASACLYRDYDLLAAVPLERVTRIKSEGARIPTEAIEEVLSIAGVKAAEIDVVAMSRSRLPIRFFKYDGFPLLHRLRRTIEATFGGTREVLIGREARIANQPDVSKLIDHKKFLRENGLPESAKLVFYDHHLGHVLPTLFHNPDWNDALLYTSDGGAETGYYSFRYFKNGKIETLFGGEDMLFKDFPVSSLALVYGFATLSLGYKINRHEGKLTGLAARGTPVHYEALRKHFNVAQDGRITSDFASNDEMKEFIFSLARTSTPEDVSSSVQKFVEEVTLESITNLVKLHPTRNLGVSGGLFANVRLNQVLADSGLFDCIFVCPPMSDQGIGLGGVLNHLMERDGMDAWLKQRRVLNDMYLGRDYTGEIDRHLESLPNVVKIEGDPVDVAVEAIIKGDAVAIYTGRMEFGPRALGARTVLASTLDHGINDSLNTRMDRSEFMPFAPVLLEDRADVVLDLPPQSRYTARFMTITCQVKPEWKTRIPAVVHVDGTARPQLIRAEDNPLYEAILRRYDHLTGIPVLVNTSFNVHEEPIINRPEECSRALLENRVDAVVTTEGFYIRKKD